MAETTGDHGGRSTGLRRKHVQILADVARRPSLGAPGRVTRGRRGRVGRLTPGARVLGLRTDDQDIALIRHAAGIAAAWTTPIFEAMRKSADCFRRGHVTSADRECAATASALQALAQLTARLAAASSDDHRIMVVGLLNRLSEVLDALERCERLGDWDRAAGVLDGPLSELLLEWSMSLLELRDGISRERPSHAPSSAPASTGSGPGGWAQGAPS